MTVEVSPACSSRVISPEFLAILIEGWQEVADLLRELGVGGIVGLEVLEITLLDDDEMARVHGEFLNDATPTDVITFDHGELLIGVETAERQAGDYATSADREIALYGIHGMLHLAGFDDKAPGEALIMASRQNELLEKVFKSL